MNQNIRTLLEKVKGVESQHRGMEAIIGANEIERFTQIIIKECILRTQHDAELYHEMGEIELESALISYRNW